MIGTLQPAPSNRFLISGTAAAASGILTVQRTISEPASASSNVCLKVDSTSAVSVLVIDCTTIGAPPPTRTWPTETPYVLRRGRPLPVTSIPAICVNILIILPEVCHTGRFASEKRLEGSPSFREGRFDQGTVRRFSAPAFAGPAI